MTRLKTPAVQRIGDHIDTAPRHQVDAILKSCRSFTGTDNPIVPPPVRLQMRHMTCGHRTESEQPRQQHTKEIRAAQMRVHQRNAAPSQLASNAFQFTRTALEGRLKQLHPRWKRLRGNPRTGLMYQQDRLARIAERSCQFVTMPDRTIHSLLRNHLAKQVGTSVLVGRSVPVDSSTAAARMLKLRCSLCHARFKSLALSEFWRNRRWNRTDQGREQAPSWDLTTSSRRSPPPALILTPADAAC